MTRLHSLVGRLCRQQRAVAAVEFALVGPLFFLVLLGSMDFGLQMYARQVLQGAVSNAGRAATLEGNAGDQSALDDMVRDRVQAIFSEAELTFTRRAYESYDEIGDPEPFTDKNNNGKYDSGECFEDLNGNRSWDADRGSAGNGGAEDVVLYTVEMDFDRLLPVWKMLGQDQHQKLTATTVLRNQPYNVNTSTREVICD